MKRKAAKECLSSIHATRVCGAGLEYCRSCFKETLEMVSEKGLFQWCLRLLLLSNFIHRGFDSTMRKEYLMMLFHS